MNEIRENINSVVTARGLYKAIRFELSNDFRSDEEQHAFIEFIYLNSVESLGKNLHKTGEKIKNSNVDRIFKSQLLREVDIQKSKLNSDVLKVISNPIGHPMTNIQRIKLVYGARNLSNYKNNMF